MTRSLISPTAVVDNVDDVMASHITTLQNWVKKMWNTFAFVGATELTISGGVITVTGNYHTVDTESDAASDDLDTISLGTDIEEASLLIIRPEHDDRTVVVKHGTGNILCVGGADLTLDDEEDFVIMIYDAGLACWLALQGGGGAVEVATSAELDTGTDNAKMATALAIAGRSETFGWIPARQSWTYASATTITVPSGAALIYSVGDKIRFKQGAGYKYFYIIAVADTLLTVTGGSDYTVATPTAITDIYYSKQATPVDFPIWFNWSPTYTGFSTAPTDTLSRFCIIGRVCYFVHNEGTNGTSNANSFSVLLPVVANTVAGSYWGGMCFFAIDNTAQITTACRWNIDSAATSVFLYTNMGTGAWTTSGGKRARLQGWYEI